MYASSDLFFIYMENTAYAYVLFSSFSYTSGWEFGTV